MYRALHDVRLVAFTTAEGTFTSASEALRKSQPAVSKLIRNLEGELGVVLFDRTKYRATLTDAARVLRALRRPDHTRSDRCARVAIRRLRAAPVPRRTRPLCPRRTAGS